MPITLATYETAVRQLMQPRWSGTIPPATLDSYINTARAQLAIDAECIRDRNSFAAPAAQNVYRFDTDLKAGLPNGQLQPIAVRQANIDGAPWPMDMRTWDWYWHYERLFDVTGTPTVAAQLGQGALGTLFIHPTPDRDYRLVLDMTLLPMDLLSDNSVPEVIPYPWTDAVPFYAAWLGFQQVQRQADAQMMIDRYNLLALRGRQATTSSNLPDNAPGGAGAKMAASHSTLTMRPQQPALGG